MVCQAYFLPITIQEATDILRNYKGDARILAGGTDLIIDMKTHKKVVKALVDISKIEGLDQIKAVKGNLCIGPMVTHTQAATSDLINQWAPVLSEACSAVGSPQIRNMGTLAGNIVNGMPAADAAIALVALGSMVKVVSWDNKPRVIPIGKLYKGVGESVIDSTREIAIEIEFPIPKDHTGTSFQRLSRRKALAFPILNVAILVRLDRDLRVFEEARIVVGPVSPLPFRPKEAEKLLIGSCANEGVIQQAGMISSNEASPRTSLRGGREYRKEMVKVLVERGIRQALARIHPKFSNL